ncbi:hypothetical protein INT48_003865 [Thamnidium elegans]|uniref:DUF221-domain-containing protein n=1 Tax=Thamnidium elegans TaxID=101142 RepID=A0A8H7SHQ9_9FUNG|nr:hypothetical protein INT48_003865 [Thamnidium elegans]
MSELDLLFKEQQRLEDILNLKAMIVQVSINLGFAICVLSLFCWLRPRHAFIYAPKAKLSQSDVRKPEPLGSGLFDWIKPVLKIKDDDLLKNIGFDAFVFIYFTRILRRLIIVITLISVFIFIPVNVVATFSTGNWPPVGLEFLSISAMNYQYGKQIEEPNHDWYWSPTVASWMFSTIVIWEMIHASRKFILFRQKYYMRQEEATKTQLPSMSPTELLQHQKQELISRTLLVHFIIPDKKTPRQVLGDNHDIVPDDFVKTMVNSISTVPCQQVLVEDGSTAKRPQIRLNWKLERTDAIKYYTERALLFESAIRRNRLKLSKNNYGWVIYPTKELAQEAFLSIEKSTRQQNFDCLPKSHVDRIRLAPHPDDIVWENMSIDKHTDQLKHWFGYGLFFSIIFAWSIPIATLGIMSNLINMIRLFPKSDQILKQNELTTGLTQSYLTPCLMVLFYFGLPDLLHFVSRQQAFKTETVVQQKTLSKLYAFFIINNMFIFTLVSIMVGIVGQIGALTMAGSLTDKRISQYIVQIAKNMSDVSSFWINYICIRSVGIIFELLQVVPLLSLILFRGKGWFGYTPRQLEKITGPPPLFKFAKHYGVTISFFTAALVYSVIAPISLPFAVIYFGLATTTFKYKLMYIYVTKVETHGKIWPLLYSIVMVSLFVFQCMMILILSLKAGMSQIYSLIPLPIITVLILIFYSRYLLKHNTLKTWIELKNSMANNNNNDSGSFNPSIIELSDMTTENCDEKDTKLINLIYQDPSLDNQLWKPMLFEHLKSLVPDVYKDHPQRHRILLNVDRTNEPSNSNSSKLDKFKAQEQLKQEMNMLLSIPQEYYTEQAGSSNSQDVYFTQDLVEPTAPTLDIIQKPPPTYTDVISQQRRHSF